MNWKQRAVKQSWPTLNYYHIVKEEIRKAMKTIRKVSLRPNPGTHDNETRVVITELVFVPT
jgi:hypothetical protein